MFEAKRLGTLAVDAGLAGYSDVMVSRWLGQYVLVPLVLSASGRKRLPQESFLWKMVCERTAQPYDML
jgi:6-phosphofructokinase 1